MPLSRLLFASIFGLALASTGCAERPTLRLHHAEIRSASFTGIGLDVYLSVNNPNSFDIEIRNVRAALTFADKYSLPEISHSPNKWLPAGQSTVVRVPVVIPYMLMPNLVNEVQHAPILRYTVKGSADVTAVRALGVEKDDYPIDEAGSIARQDLLSAAGISL
jgi:hypothetical protein